MHLRPLHKLKNIDFIACRGSLLLFPRNDSIFVHVSPTRGLFSLSLADNNLATLDADITNALAPGASLRLFGNPWSCDCRVTWLRNATAQDDVIPESDDDVSESNDDVTAGNATTVTSLRRVKIPDARQIVCKEPSHLTGEQVGPSGGRFHNHDLKVAALGNQCAICLS